MAQSKGRSGTDVRAWLLPVVCVSAAIAWTTGLLDTVSVGWVMTAGLVALAAAVERCRAGLRARSRARSEGALRWSAFERGLAALVPWWLARTTIVQMRLLAALVAWPIDVRRPRGPGEFGYHRGMKPLLWLLAGAVVVEGAVLEIVLLVILGASAWTWAGLGVHAYVLALVGGLAAGLAGRPHVVADYELRLRDGVLTEVVVPVWAVGRARSERHDNLGRSGLVVDEQASVATLAHGESTVVLGLEPAQQLTVDGVRMRVPIARIRLTADSPDEFVRALCRSGSRPES